MGIDRVEFDKWLRRIDVETKAAKLFNEIWKEYGEVTIESVLDKHIRRLISRRKSKQRAHRARKAAKGAVTA